MSLRDGLFQKEPERLAIPTTTAYPPMRGSEQYNHQELQYVHVSERIH